MSAMERQDNAVPQCHLDGTSEVVDPATLFRCSMLVDVLRDTAKDLLSRECTTSASAISALAKQHNRLRATVAQCVSGRLTKDLLRQVPRMQGPQALDHIVVTAATMACWIDGVMQAPLAAASYHASRMQMLKQANELTSLVQEAGQLHTGRYL